MQIGLLQTGHAPDSLTPALGDYADMFERLLAGHGFDFRRWDVVDMDFPADVRACDGWLLTGSRHGAYENLPFIPPLQDFIRAAYAAHVPMAGICFGHQIIAQALGGTVEKFSGGWAVGATDYMLDGQRMTLNAWHQDQVTQLPDGAQVIGGNAFCRYGALRYGDRALTVQPHPEFGADMIQGLIDHRGKGVVPDALLETAQERLQSPDDGLKFGAKIAAFFKTSVKTNFKTSPEVQDG